MDGLWTHAYPQYKIPVMILSSALWERAENELGSSRGKINSFPLFLLLLFFYLFVFVVICVAVCLFFKTEVSLYSPIVLELAL